MKAHEHDRDRIMALAEGSLDATEARAAQSEMAACEECLAELGLQKAALELLRTAPAVAMTDMEAARFRRDLDTALGHERTATAAANPPRWRQLNWVPIFSVAALLVALVLIAPALDLLGGGGDDSAADVVTLGDDEASDDAGASEAPPAAALEERSLAAADEPTEGDDGAAFATPTSTTAAAEDTAAGDAASIDDELMALREALLEVPDLDAPDVVALAYGIAPPIAEDDRCVTEGAEALELDPASSSQLGRLAWADGELVITVHEDGEELIVLAHDVATCEIVGRVP